MIVLIKSQSKNTFVVAKKYTTKNAFEHTINAKMTPLNIMIH